jgi:hypothetical protein
MELLIDEEAKERKEEAHTFSFQGRCIVCHLIRNLFE